MENLVTNKGLGRGVLLGTPPTYAWRFGEPLPTDRNMHRWSPLGQHVVAQFGAYYKLSYDPVSGSSTMVRCSEDGGPWPS